MNSTFGVAFDSTVQLQTTKTTLMARTAKIAPIAKEFSNTFNTVDQQLAKHGYYRFPGTNVTMLPHKEASGKYRTGLDEKALYLNNLSEEEKIAEIKRIREDKARLEEALGLPGSGILDPTSPFWNFAASSATLKERFGTDVKVSPVKLGTSEMFFNLSEGDVMKEITWNWLRVHPRIAPSIDAYRRGDVPSDTQYYIADDEAESKDTYSRKKVINQAIVSLEALGPSKRKMIGRLMGLPITEDTTEETVYNLIDAQLKETEFKSGKNKGMAPVSLFNDLLKTTDDRLKVKDLVEQALTHSIYRIGVGGKIMEGEVVASPSREDLVEYLLKDENQMDLLALEKKLTNKKLK